MWYGMRQLTLAHYDSHSSYTDGLNDHETDKVASFDNNRSYELFMAVIVYFFTNSDI